jgi:hypothetical protein
VSVTLTFAGKAGAYQSGAPLQDSTLISGSQFAPKDYTWVEMMDNDKHASFLGTIKRYEFVMYRFRNKLMCLSRSVAVIDYNNKTLA